MPIFRVEKTRDYTVMANYHLRDERLSLKAQGLLSKILSLPDDWDFTVAGLASMCRDGKDSVRSGLEELAVAGYIRRSRSHNADGTFGGNEYTVYERPAEESDEPDGLPLSENPTMAPSSENPSLDKPTLAEPTMENPTQLNTKRQSTKITKPPIVPHGGRRAKSVPAWEPEIFERFWAAYPKPGRTDRVAAVREWDRLKPDKALMLRMSRALDLYKASDQWQRGIGIPYACRWLSHRRWENPPDPAPSCAIQQGGGSVQSPEVEVW